MIKKYWEDFYLTFPMIKPDKWLDKYKFLLINCTRILDLGCGNGANENYLRKLDIYPMACDISHNAIKIMNELHPRCEAKVVDISDKLPYYDKQVDLIIADLSLHYFDSETTVKVVEELERILSDNGFVIGRVNAKRGIRKDKNFVEIEENFYEENGCYRRYFSREDIGKYFSRFNVLVNREAVTSKYGHKKYIIEFLLQKFVE